MTHALEKAFGYQENPREGVAMRRHFDIIAESLRDDIRIIAEGLIDA